MVVISMGGIINKCFGCVGDLLIIGVGMLVENGNVVILCIGMGEYFICYVVVGDIVVCMCYFKEDVYIVCEIVV